MLGQTPALLLIMKFKNKHNTTSKILEAKQLGICQEAIKNPPVLQPPSWTLMPACDQSQLLLRGGQTGQPAYIPLRHQSCP